MRPRMRRRWTLVGTESLKNGVAVLTYRVAR